MQQGQSRSAFVAGLIGLTVAAGCLESPSGNVGDDVSLESRALAGDTARGTIPQGLPARLTVGLFEDTGSSWMKSSGVKWDVRYRYLTKGWVNNWAWGGHDGSFARSYFNESSSQGFVPSVQYYQLSGEPGGGEAQTLAKVQNAATMKAYFGDFKILMQRIKDFGKPVVVLMEADAHGFLQQQSGSNPNAYAAVRDTGLSELAGLPNTVAGWGLAFLQMRKAVGASNAIIGLHISGWASGKDIAHSNVTDALGPEVDKVFNFLAGFGLIPNVTGQQYDLLVGDPLDRDADHYRLVRGENRWWDASDSAPITSMSFNRYAEWLRLWNLKSSKRWVLWQIPLGNSNHKNIHNNGSSAAGYKDNRPEYFFNGSTAHVSKFANAGVISLLFGGGAAGMSGFTNDTYSDGQLFMKSRAGAFLNAGGLAIAAGGGTGGSGGSGGSGGTGGSGGVPAPADTSPYNFETSNQGWNSSGGMITSAARSTDRAFLGLASLKATFNGAAGVQAVRVGAPPTPPGAVLTFRIWFPAGSRITAIQPYVLQGAGGGWSWTGNWQSTTALRADQWNTIQVTVPANAVTPLAEMGVQFTTNGTWAGAAYVDAVSW